MHDSRVLQGKRSSEEAYTCMYFPRTHNYITMTCRQLMNRETYNNIGIAMSTRETRTLGKHISHACMQPMHPCRNSPLLAI